MYSPISKILTDYKNGKIEHWDAHDKILAFSAINSFISVGEKEPPKYKELLVQSPDGQNYIASWREAYGIFTCQNKGEDSFDWKWKEI